jgi:hypothetical protein
MISSIGGNVCRIGDSMLTNVDFLHFDVKKACNAVSSLAVVAVPAQQQKGGSDCGLFALANLTSEFFGRDMSTQNYDQSLMRPHSRHTLMKQKTASPALEGGVRKLSP